MFFRVRDRRHRLPAPPLPVQALETVRVPALVLGPESVPAKELLMAEATLRLRLSHRLPPKNSQLTLLRAAPGGTRFRPCVPAFLPVLQPSAYLSAASQLACARPLSCAPVSPRPAS